MNFTVLRAGRRLRPHEEAWVDEYVKRIGRFAKITVDTVRERTLEADYDALVRRVPKNARRVVLDPSGRALDTEGFGRLLTGHVAFLLGGSYGFPPRAREEADVVLSLGPLTLPHRIALLVLIEQIYRALTIRAGSPYHH